MKTRTHILSAALLPLLLLVSLASAAQTTAFKANHQPLALLPEGDASLFFLDGTLYSTSNGVILAAQRRGGDILRFVPDTLLVKMHDAVDYVVRHPVSGDLYFTVKDKKGFSVLYVSHTETGKRAKIKRVDMNDLSVIHPTFSSDGRFMVFSSTGRNRSFGDFDLWYSKLGKEGWSNPRNIGNRVNTRMDETNPVINGEYLYFCSRGHNADDLHPALYVTPLMARRIEGDTVGMLQIGRGRVLRMPSPVTLSGSSSLSIAFDTLGGHTYWLRRNGDASDVRPVYSLSCPLGARYLWGYVHRVSGEVLAGAKVSVLQSSEVITTAITDSMGFYGLYLPCGDDFTLRYHYDGCFADTLLMPALSATGEYPVVEEQRDITLDGIPLRSLVYYYDLFEPNVSLAISPHGRAVLAPLVRFLADNPNYHARLLLSNDITDNADFNGLLTEQRLKVLRDYLTPLLPPTVKLDFWNGCQGGQSCSSASGQSRLTVVVQP